MEGVVESVLLFGGTVDELGASDETDEAVAYVGDAEAGT